MQKRTADLGSAPLGTLLIRLSLPGMIGMLVIALYGVADAFWLARLGELALAAQAVAFPWQMVVGAVGIGMAVGASSLVSRRFGEGRTEQVDDTAGQVLFLAAGVGVPLTGLILLFPAPLLRLFGATPELMPLAQAFLIAGAWGAPFVLFAQGANGLYRGSGNAWFPMVIMGGSALVNMGLDPLLIFGLGPFPALGIAGAGLATAISQCFAALGSALYMWSRHSGYVIRLRNTRPRVSLLADIAQVGASTFAMHLMGSLVVSIYNWVLGGFSATAIAAFGLTWRMLMLSFPLVIGAAQGLLPVVGFNYGARDYQRVWQAVGLAARSVAAVAAALGLLLAGLAPQITSLFTQEPELARLTILAMRLAVSALVVTGPAVMFISTLQGMGYGGTALLLSLTRQLLFLLPALWLLSRWYGVEGAYAAQPVAEVLSFLLAGALLWRIHQRYPPREPEAESDSTPVAAPESG